MLDVRIADRIEPLLDLLVHQLVVPGPDPLAREWVAVPSIGMRRWLSQRLSERLGGSALGSDGISANIDLPFPAELRWRVLQTDLGNQTDPANRADQEGDRSDPWRVDRLTWAVLGVLGSDASRLDDALSPLAERPVGGTLAGRAAALADLLDRYGVHRPDMVRAWLDHRDVDGAGSPLDASQVWQPRLFRAVREKVGRPGPPERLPSVLDALREGAAQVVLPQRVFLFGLSTLPPDMAALLDALGRHRDVTVLLLAPSASLAGAVAGRADWDVGRGRSTLRRDHDLASMVHHPLLRSWGTASRETAALLGASGAPTTLVPTDPTPPGSGAVADGRAGTDQPSLFDQPADQPPDQPADGAPARSSLLARLQQDIRSDSAPDGTHGLERGDRSIQVHACTGATRQVEVLRDALLHLLRTSAERDGERALTEGDIAVLCPRIEQFSPIIQAVFGPSEDVAATADDATPRLRYRITDRTTRSDVPLLGALSALLDLVPSRFSASAVSDFIGLPPVRDRFRLGVDDLGLMDHWIADAHVRWGLDGDHRATWDMPGDFGANTWEAGLDQLLMGTAVRSRDTLAVGDVAPLPVGEGATAVAARVAEAVRTLAHVRSGLLERRPLEAWCTALGSAVDSLCSLPFSEAWQRRRLDRVLEDLVDASRGPDGLPSGVLLSLADLRRLLADLLVGDPARAAFGTGAITFCSLSPLRSVPHRVVCVLGLDQDALPRGVASGDDLLAGDPALGDRDPRAETRQLLLEAVLAAGDTLVITHGAADVRTNAPVPPAVVLDELMDCLADTCASGRDELSAQVRVTHPRQAFAASNFEPGGLGAGAPDGPWSFSPVALSGARAMVGRPAVSVPAPLLVRPLPSAAPTGPVVELADLRSFLARPVRVFLTQRLGLWLPDRADDVSDELPVVLDGLESYKVGDELLGCAIRGEPQDPVVEVLRASGALPPGVIGQDLVSRLSGEVELYVEEAGRLGVPLEPDHRQEVDLALPDGRRIRGSVRCCNPAAPGPLTVRFTRPKDHHRLLLALDLLALTAQDPEVDRRAVSIHRSLSGAKAQVTVTELGVAAGTPEDRRALALAALAELVAIRDEGMDLPLPLFDATSRHISLGEWGQATKAWGDDASGEGADPYHRLAFGALTFAELLRLPLGDHGAVPMARRLWGTVDGAVVDAGDHAGAGREDVAT